MWFQPPSSPKAASRRLDISSILQRIPYRDTVSNYRDSNCLVADLSMFIVLYVPKGKYI